MWEESVSHSVVCDSGTSWIVVCQAPLSMGILQARILEWVVMPSPGDLPNPGIEPRPPALQAGYYCLSHQGCLHFISVVEFIYVELLVLFSKYIIT